MKNLIKLFSVTIVLFILTTSLYSHCQIPCGIYNDQTRFTLIREHISTIEKSMNLVNKLSTDIDKNMNQLVRWVNNKDEHADKLTNIITFYFLSQRVKIKEKNDESEFAKYQKMVTILHQTMVYSMKCKQTTDLNNVKKLREFINDFENIYFSKNAKDHLKGNHNK